MINQRYSTRGREPLSAKRKNNKLDLNIKSTQLQQLKPTSLYPSFKNTLLSNEESLFKPPGMKSIYEGNKVNV